PISLARGAGVRDHRPSALAGGAGTADAEEALLVAHLPASAAGAACHRGLARRQSGAMAGRARFVPADLHFLGRAEDRLFEVEFQVFAHIGAALLPTAAAPAEEVPETEQVAENVAEVLENGGIKSHAAGRSPAHPRMPEAVVLCALLRIHQNAVSLGAFLEFLFGAGIIGIAVGMVLQRHLAVGALDLLLAGGAADAQHLVIVAFAVTGQSAPHLP